MDGVLCVNSSSLIIDDVPTQESSLAKSPLILSFEPTIKQREAELESKYIILNSHTFKETNCSKLLDAWRTMHNNKY